MPMPPDARARQPYPDAMSVHRLWGRTLTLPRLAVFAWAAIMLVICVRVLIQPQEHSVYPIFSYAAEKWVEGKDLYTGERWPELDLYRYSPLVAALLVPFSLFPDGVGGVLWRLVSFGVFAWGFAWWCRRATPGGEFLTDRQRAMLWLLLIPLSLASLNNGQANVIVTGLLLLAITGAGERRWNLAAVCMALACLFKIYPIA